MAKPFNLLRAKLVENEFTNETLARELLLTPGTVSRKLNAHSPWTSEEMWLIMQLICEPAQNLHKIFPPYGQNEPEAKCMRGRRTA